MEALHVDNNKINFKTKKFKEILKKYGNKLIYEAMNFDEFNKVYTCDIKEESKKLELGSKKKPNLLRDIYKVFNILFLKKYIIYILYIIYGLFSK